MKDKAIFSTFWKKDKVLDLKIDNNKQLAWNIYGDKIAKEHIKKWHRFHFWIKYKTIVPMLKLLNKFMKKNLIKEIPEEPYNKNLVIFDRAVEKSLVTWSELLQFGRIRKRNIFDKFIINKRNKSGSQELVRMMKNLLITGSLNDTAYRTLLDLVLFNIAIEMNKEYRSHPDWIFYDSRGIFDVNFKKASELIVEYKEKIKNIDNVLEKLIEQEERLKENGRS